MITIVPDEVKAADVSRSLQEELSDQLHASATQFAQLVDTYSSQTRDSRDLLVVLLRLLRAWLPCGLSLAKLFTEHRSSFDLVCLAVQATDVEVATQGCGVIKDIVVLKEYPRPAARTEALKVLVNCLSQSVHGHIAAHIPGYINSSEHRITRLLRDEAGSVDPDFDIGALMAEYSNTLGTLASAEGESQLLCTGYHDESSTAQETELLVTFHNASMAVAHLRPRKMAVNLFEFWTEYDGLSPAECHVYVRETVLYEFYCVLTSHCTYPADALRWGATERDYSEDQEDFVNFRDWRLGLPEMLKLCLNSLKGRFFAVLQSRFELFAQQLPRWMHLEVILYVLHSCMDTVKETVTKALYKDKAYQQSIVQFLYTVTRCVLAVPGDVYMEHRLLSLYQAVCKYIGALTFLLVGSTDALPVMQVQPSPDNATRGQPAYVSDFYYQAVGQMVQAVSCGHETTSTEAAKAVHKLCVHGSKKLTDSAGNTSAESWQTLLQLISATAQYVLAGTVPVGTLLVLTEACTRTVMTLPSHELKSQLLSTLGQSIIQALMAACSAPAPTQSVEEARIVALLSLVSQLVRFSDVPTEGLAEGEANMGHPLLPFLMQFWPVLKQLSADPRVAQCPEVGSAIFDIFGKVLMSVGSAVFSEVPNMTFAILSATGSRSASAGAALSCARVLVETLSRHAQSENAAGNAAAAQQSQQHLLQLVVSVTDQYALSPEFTALLAQPPSAGSSGECMRLFGAAPDAMEQYFALIHAYLVFRREDFVTSAAQLSEKVLGLSCACLSHCTERDPLRSLLHALQGLLVPTSRESEGATPPTQAPVLQALTQYGARLVHLLLLMLSDGRVPASLVPNITETLYCLIIACETPVTSNSGTAGATLQAQCAAWVEAAVMSPELFPPLTELSQRQLLGQAILGLAGARSRRFKSLLQDLHKICGSELTADTLLAYA
jgi:hypothetical protein